MRRRLATISVMFLVCLTGLVSGCTGGNEDPRELLTQAVSSIIGQDDFTFVGTTNRHMSGGSLEKAYTFTGSVSGHNDIYIEPLEASESSSDAGVYANSGMLHYSKVNKQWVINGGNSRQQHLLYSLNPLIHAEYLNREAKSVNVETEQSTNEVTVLHAAIEEKNLLASFQQQIRAEHEEVIAAAQQELDRHPEDVELQKELTNYIAEAEQRLEDMLSSLRIDANYRLEVANRSRKLNTMQVMAQLKYDFEGESRVEKIDTVYQFQ